MANVEFTLIKERAMSDGEIGLPNDQEARAMRAALSEPIAIAGVWTPWAETICLRCHGFTQRVQFDMQQLLPIPRPNDCGMCNCDICGHQIWLEQKVAWEREMVGILQKTFPTYRSDMQQTGGMNSAGAIAISGWDDEGAIYPYMMFVVEEEDQGEDPKFAVWLQRSEDDDGITIGSFMSRFDVVRLIGRVQEDTNTVERIMESAIK